MTHRGDRLESKMEHKIVQTTQELILMIKEEVLEKQYQLQKQKGTLNKDEIDRWIDEKVKTVDRISLRIKNEN